MKYSVLNNVESPKDLKHLSLIELTTLAEELRHFIINIVATKAGHLGSSLGVIELSIAIHYIYDTPTDLIIWDVGHQAYVHKILTERKSIFETNRQLGGLSGFPKISESKYDAFGVGHSSTSISAILGMSIASKIKNKVKEHIAIIGDASIASGMAFEALNHAGATNNNITVILNDNTIGIDPSVGALKEYLKDVKSGISERDNIFEALNFKYLGPIDGHDLDTLIKTMKTLKSIEGPKFLHIVTKKGKGLKQAEENQITYHAPGKFNPTTGDIEVPKTNNLAPKFQDIFGLTILELAKQNDKIIGITPAMPTGSSLKYMIEAFPERAFDVGIAEQHAVTLAAGMATQGLIPFCTIYSTFLQRAYDQVIHDVALQNLPVIFCVDRAGLVGEDGPTHHGVFDLSFLNCIPNLIIYAPKDAIEFRNILYTAQLGLNHPIAIRYPRGKGEILDWKQPFKKLDIGKAKELKKGTKLAVISIGTIAQNITKAINKLDNNSEIGHYDIRFLKPLDEDLLHSVFSSYKIILTIEDNALIGGLFSTISTFASKYNYSNPINCIGIPDEFIEHGTVEQLHDLVRLASEKIEEKMRYLLK